MSHHEAAVRWWNADESERIVFCRLTQMGLLRLLTTASVMNQKPLTSAAAWTVYDRLFADQRVGSRPEPRGLDVVFRTDRFVGRGVAKGVGGCDLSAFAAELGGEVVTLDKDSPRAPPPPFSSLNKTLRPGPVRRASFLERAYGGIGKATEMAGDLAIALADGKVRRLTNWRPPARSPARNGNASSWAAPGRPKRRSSGSIGS